MSWLLVEGLTGGCLIDGPVPLVKHLRLSVVLHVAAVQGVLIVVHAGIKEIETGFRTAYLEYLWRCRHTSASTTLFLTQKSRLKVLVKLLTPLTLLLLISIHTFCWIVPLLEESEIVLILVRALISFTSKGLLLVICKGS